MLPLAAQFSDENAPAQIRLRDTLTQRLTAPEGVFARQYVPPEQRGIGDYETVKEGNLLRLVLMQKIFTGQAADALRPREMRPLDPRHFDITSNGVWLRVTSKPRAVRLIGEIGREYRQVMCVTTVDDDNNSAEFFMGPATGGVAVRRMVRRVRYSAPNLESLRLDMEELGPDAYTNDLYTRPAREYREALPRRLRRGLPDSWPDHILRRR